MTLESDLSQMLADLSLALAELLDSGVGPAREPHGARALSQSVFRHEKRERCASDGKPEKEWRGLGETNGGRSSQQRAIGSLCQFSPLQLKQSYECTASDTKRRPERRRGDARNETATRVELGDAASQKTLYLNTRRT